MFKCIGFAHAATFLVIASTVVVTACSDDNNNNPTSSSTSTGTGGSGGSGGSGGAGGMGGEMQPPPPIPAKVVAAFDPAKGELPEGLVISPDGKDAYVGFAVTGQIKKVSLADGTVSDFGSVPPPPPMNKGFVLGLALSPMGDVYVGVGSFDPTYQPGIYKIPAAGGMGAIFSQDPTMIVPNGIAVDTDGSLFVAESNTGKVFHVNTDGTAATWYEDAVNTKADPNTNCPSSLSLGANGIAIAGGAVWITNTDSASITKIEKKTDGTAGTATPIVAPACLQLAGADGLTVGPDGLYVAANQQNAILRVALDGKKIDVVSKGMGLDFPASVAYVPGPMGDTLYVTNAAFISAQIMNNPKPSLSKIDLPHVQ